MRQKAPFSVSDSTSSVVALCTIECDCNATNFNNFFKSFWEYFLGALVIFWIEGM
jgi:hypothetical protein